MRLSRTDRLVTEDEQGVTLTVALMLTLVLSLLGLVSVSTAIHGLSQSVNARKQFQALSGAEAGINVELANVKQAAFSGTISSISCPAARQYITVAPGSHYGSQTAIGAGNAASIQSYSLQYATDTNLNKISSDNLKSCKGTITTHYHNSSWYLMLVATGYTSSTAPAPPDIRSVTLRISSSSGGSTTTTTMNPGPTTSTSVANGGNTPASLDKAVFANANLTDSTTLYLYDQSNPLTGNANVYSNGPVSCPSQPQLMDIHGGDLQVEVSGAGPGTATITGACYVADNIYDANGDVDLGSPSHAAYFYGGSLLAGNGNVSISSVSGVNSVGAPAPNVNIDASGTVFSPGCGVSVVCKSLDSHAGAGIPSAEQFPSMDDTDLSPWTSAGFVQFAGGGCNANSFFKWTGNNPHQKSLWVTSGCGRQLTLRGTYDFPSDTVIFSPTGFDLSGVVFNGSGTVYLIVPVSAVGGTPGSPSCAPTQGEVDIGGSSSELYTNTLLYTPCDFVNWAHSIMYGQVYAGHDWSNVPGGALTQYFQLTNPPSGSVTTSVTVPNGTTTTTVPQATTTTTGGSSPGQASISVLSFS